MTAADATPIALVVAYSFFVAFLLWSERMRRKRQIEWLRKQVTLTAWRLQELEREGRPNEGLATLLRSDLNYYRREIEYARRWL